MSRATRILLFLLPIAALLLVLREVVFFGGFFFSGDVLLANLPFLAYRGSGAPLIMQHILSGYPLFVSVNASWFYPVSTFLFTHLLATHAYVLLDVGNITLAYLFTYLYARKINLDTIPAVMAGLVFVFSGQLMLWVPSIIATAFYFILPASLYFFEVSIRAKPLYKTTLLTLTGVLLGIGWLSSNVQFLIYIHSFYFVYVLARLLVPWGQRRWGVAFVSLSIPYLVSFAVGLPMIQAVLAFQSQSLRAGGVPLAQAVGSGDMPWDFIHYVLPFWNLSFFPVALPNLYIGILPLALLLIAFALWKKLQHNAYAVLYAGTLVFCLVASVRYSPLSIALHYLPFWSALRDAPRIMFIGGFAEAMLVAICLQYIVHNYGELALYRMRTVQVLRAFLLYVVVPVFVLFTLVRIFFFKIIEAKLDAYFLAHKYAGTTQLPKEHYLTIITTYVHQALDQFSFFDVQAVYLVLFAVLSLVLLKCQRLLSKEHFAALALILVGLNFTAVFWTYYPTVPAARIFSIPQSAQAVIVNEAGSVAPFRVYSIFPAMTIYNDSVTCPQSPSDTVELQQELMQPNSTMFYKMDTIDGYDNYMPERVSQTLNYIVSESTGTSPQAFLERIPLQDKLTKIVSRKNVMRALNIKYLVSGTPIADNNLTLRLHSKVGACASDVYTYELSGTWPRYFVSNAVYSSSASADASSALAELNTYASPVIVLNDASKVPPLPRTVVTKAVMPISGYTTLSFKGISCTGACGLFVGNAYLFGWSATVDGVAAPVLRVNYLYMAVMLEAGTHDVEWTYQKPL